LRSNYIVHLEFHDTEMPDKIPVSWNFVLKRSGQTLYQKSIHVEAVSKKDTKAVFGEYI
jgi:hypothetical protein